MSAEADERITVYRPNQRHDLGFWQTWAEIVRNTLRARGLIWELFKRDFLATYKKSFIGFTWIFLSPIVGIVSWVFLKHTGLLQPGDVGIPYPAYVLVGSSMWGLFMGFCRSATETLSAGQSFIMQVSYPHETLLFKQSAQQVAEFAVTFALILGVLLAFGITPSWKLVLFPLVALPLFMLAAGLGLLLSMIAIVAVDVRRVADKGLELVMFMVPVVYAGDVPHPLIQALIPWNPLTYLVCSARDVVIWGRLYDGHFGALGYAAASLLALVVFLGSWRLFFLGEARIVERML